MISIKLQEGEKELLGEHLKTSPLILVRLKAQAIVMRNKGLKQRDIADLIFKDKRTVQRWIKEFSETRMSSIFSGHQNNENAGKLTKEQKKEIKEALSKQPSEYGIPKEFWDPPSLKRYIDVKFDVVYESRQSYHFLLKFSNLSFKQPDKFDIRRDDAFVKRRIGEIRNEIKEYLNKDDWEVFASDETRIMLEAITRRAWLKKGEKTIIKVKRGNEYQSYIGLLNQKSGRCHVFELAWQNQEEILKALKIFLKKYPNKKICVVWDNAKFHKGKLIRSTLKKSELLERVHLINFPPYAPDTNPIEHVWKDAKHKISNIQFENFEKTKEAFRKSIAGRKFDYKI